MEIEAVDYLKSRGFKFNDHTNKFKSFEEFSNFKQFIQENYTRKLNIVMLNTNNNILGFKLGSNKNLIKGANNANQLKSNFLNKNNRHLYI
jgi:hypothetical protein